MLNFPDASPEIVEIVLTGGSCAGKTSALQLLSQSLREKKYAVLAVPESVTMLATSGIPDLGEISRNDLARGCLFQAQVFAMQQALRRAHRNLAQMFYTPKVIILYDRGEMDAQAYHDHDCLHGFAAAQGQTLEEIRDSYTAIMHLVTAANGAEAAFSTRTNPARWDTPEEACYFDQKLYKAWSGHKQHVVIDNSTDFIGKMDRLLQAVLRIVGDDTAQDSTDETVLGRVVELFGEAATRPDLVSN